MGVVLPSQLKSLHVHQSHDFSVLALDFHTTSNEKHFFKQLLASCLVCQYKQHRDFQCGNCLTDVRVFFLRLDESLGETTSIFAWYLRTSVLLLCSTKPLCLCEWNQNLIFDIFKIYFAQSSFHVATEHMEMIWIYTTCPLKMALQNLVLIWMPFC